MVPLREASRGIKRIECWNEDVMRGQLFSGMYGRIQFMEAAKLDPKMRDMIPTLDMLADGLNRNGTPDLSVWVQWARPFWRWLRRHPKTSAAVVMDMARTYCLFYGTNNPLVSYYIGEEIDSVIPSPERETDDDEVTTHVVV